jgi:hypothetical protein
LSTLSTEDIGQFRRHHFGRAAEVAAGRGDVAADFLDVKEDRQVVTTSCQAGIALSAW